MYIKITRDTPFYDYDETVLAILDSQEILFAVTSPQDDGTTIVKFRDGSQIVIGILINDFTEQLWKKVKRNSKSRVQAKSVNTLE